MAMTQFFALFLLVSFLLLLLTCVSLIGILLKMLRNKLSQGYLVACVCVIYTVQAQVLWHVTYDKLRGEVCGKFEQDVTAILGSFFLLLKPSLLFCWIGVIPTRLNYQWLYLLCI